MTRGELRDLIRSADVYKMSLGRNATLEDEAIKTGSLVFASEKKFFEAVQGGSDDSILRAGKSIRDAKYRRESPKDEAIEAWRRNIDTFCSLPSNVLVLHWEANLKKLHWGIPEGTYKRDREELNELGQTDLIFHRPLAGGWRSINLDGISLSNIHPKAIEIAINIGTLSRVQTDPDYFRAIILGDDTTAWESQPLWQVKAKEKGWYPKDTTSILAARRKTRITPDIEEATVHFLNEMDEIARMAATAIHTAAYANGQTTLTTIKNKDVSFTRAELEEEIASLLNEQNSRCALTGYDFKRPNTNVHLKMSLDRKDSNKGYVAGNLQIVTRAANFYKSASGEADWALKAKALEQMAIAIQQRRKAATLSSLSADPSRIGEGRR